MVQYSFRNTVFPATSHAGSKKGWGRVKGMPALYPPVFLEDFIRSPLLSCVASLYRAVREAEKWSVVAGYIAPPDENLCCQQEGMDLVNS
jgi:hypothetical protein